MKSRRKFVRELGTGLGAAAFLSRLGRSSLLEAAQADAATDYKALVCVFLFGGNDANNMVIPYDDYASYQKVRGTNLTIAKASLLKVDSASQRAAFGLHPSLVELQALYAKKSLAVLANVGTLSAPLTRAQYLAGGSRPESLFSHSDQQAEWQSAVTSSTDPLALTGWGGRAADTLASLNGVSFPMLLSTAGLSLFTTGVHAQPLVPGGALQGFNTSTTSKARYDALLKLLTLDREAKLVDASSTISQTAIDSSAALNTALSGATPLKTVFPGTTLGTQLKTIATVLSIRSALKMNRQIFFASLGGFDTHTGQLAAQGALLTQVSQALGAFYDATVELGIAPSVTAFTLSDFARTFQPNGGGGSDHAWGGHHFVVGGSVKGGDVFGAYPNLAPGGPDDATSEGRWIPTTSVDQYGATLAQWFGLPSGSLRSVFPNIGSFSPSNLGFLA